MLVMLELSYYTLFVWLLLFVMIPGQNMYGSRKKTTMQSKRSAWAAPMHCKRTARQRYGVSWVILILLIQFPPTRPPGLEVKQLEMSKTYFLNLENMEDDLPGRRPQLKMTLKAKNSCIWAKLAFESQIEPELGTAQPQLVSLFLLVLTFLRERVVKFCM